ncbi:hypothetical protein [Nocardioides sp. LML1-1-1.1]|uniref:hypothetical protein n=1 Tax=Nocardioides sp. LML1-1-1.1 TaxID=3135248 RepID=UPI003419882C
MSQTATPQAAPPPPATAAAPAPVAVPDAAPTHVDTPRRLNQWQLIGMSVAIVFGLVSALVQFVGWQADGRAAADTEQLGRVQKIQSTLLSADALATNAFLVGGLEDPDQRAKYDAAIDEVLREIASASRAQEADLEVLKDLNVAVTTYATAVAQARANNRLGYPIGAEYLSGASAELRATAIPILDALVAANTDRAEGSMAGQHPFWLLLVGLLALAALFVLNRQLAQAFHRRLNKGLVVAAIIVLGVTVVTVFAAFIRDSSNDSLRDNEFAAAVSLANTRTAANDAKAIESLRLIQRGSGAAAEEKWAAARTEVEKGLGRADAVADWNAYAERHQALVALDDGGDWDRAKDLATTSSPEGTTAPFQDFDEETAAEAQKQSDIAVEDLDSGRLLALLFSGLTVLLGVVAAVAVARGIGERRREFS